MKSALFFLCGIGCGAAVMLVASTYYFEESTSAEFKRQDEQIAAANKRCDRAEDAKRDIETWQSAALTCFQFSTDVLTREVAAATRASGRLPSGHSSRSAQGENRAVLPHLAPGISSGPLGELSGGLSRKHVPRSEPAALVRAATDATAHPHAPAPAPGISPDSLGAVSRGRLTPVDVAKWSLPPHSQASPASAEPGAVNADRYGPGATTPNEGPARVLSMEAK